MSTNTVNNDNQQFQEQLEAYIKHMGQELQDAEELIEALENAQGNKGKYEEYERHLLSQMGWSSMEGLSQTAIDKAMEHVITDASHFTQMAVAVAKQYLAYESVIHSFDTTIQQKEKALESIDPNISGTITSLNELIEKSAKELATNSNITDFNKALGQIDQIVLQFCQVVMDKIQVDLAEAGMKKFGQDPNHAAAVLEFAAMALHGEFNEQNSLQSIQNEVISEATNAQEEKSSAQSDLKTWHWYDAIINFFGGHAGPDVDKDNATVRAANAMLSLLSKVEELISPMITTVDPGMEQFQVQLEDLKKRFEEFLNGKGSLLQLKDAMIAALSIMVGIIAETSKEASMFNKEMSQGTQATAQANLKDSLSEQEVIEDAKKYAAVMGTLLNVLKYVGMAVIFLMNPSAAMAIMVVIDAILNATGVMGMLEKAIADKVGGTGGAIITGLIEAVGTAGGAAALEALVSKVVVQAAMEVTEKEVESVVSNVIKTTVESATKAAGKAGEEAAEKVVTQAVEQAVQQAEKKVAEAFLSKTLSQVITSLVKGDLKIAMEVAQKEAAEAAAEAVQSLAETAAKDGAQVVSETEIEQLAETAANKAAANVLKISAEDAAKLGARSVLAKFAIRAGFMGLASAGSTQLMNNIVAEIAKKDKKDLDQTWQVALQIVNAILQLVGMLGSSGMNVTAFGSSGFLSKLFLTTTVAEGAASTVASAGEAEANFEQAGAVKAIAQNQANLDLMQFVLEQLQKNGNIERSEYAKQMQQVAKTNVQLSMHFNDAEIAVAQALAVSAV